MMSEKNMFENELRPEPTAREQLVAHIPIALLVFGVLATFVAMHTAITGLIAAGLAHALIGLVLVAVRRHRQNTTSQAQR